MRFLRCGKYNASLQKCNLVTDAIRKLVWSHLQHTWWGKASLLKADKADRARCGQMLPNEPLKSTKPKSEERETFICNKDFEHGLTRLWKRRKYVVGLALIRWWSKISLLLGCRGFPYCCLYSRDWDFQNLFSLINHQQKTRKTCSMTHVVELTLIISHTVQFIYIT